MLADIKYFILTHIHCKPWTLFMWNVQVTLLCMQIITASNRFFFDLQGTQYNHETIFSFLYFMDVILDCKLFERGFVFPFCNSTEMRIQLV